MKGFTFATFADVNPFLLHVSFDSLVFVLSTHMCICTTCIESKFNLDALHGSDGGTSQAFFYC